MDYGESRLGAGCDGASPRDTSFTMGGSKIRL